VCVEWHGWKATLHATLPLIADVQRLELDSIARFS
jgi:hypothetical protein